MTTDIKEREREKTKLGREVLRETTFKTGGKAITFSPVLKVPRQCTLALLVEARTKL
jgi:hypothetical protein